MSDKVAYTLTNDSIHLSFGGNQVTISRQHRLYGQIRDLIKDGKEDNVPTLFLNSTTNNQNSPNLTEYIKDSGLVLVGDSLKDKDGEMLPGVLSDRLMELHGENLPVDRLVKFWKNLKQNPSMNSREQLYKFLEQKGHPLTDDGCFIAYRGVRVDFKDLHTGTFDNSPGQVLEMPRSQVDDNPNRTCSKGFHVAAWEYANSFGPLTVKVKVNPMDVVAVPSDYNGQKMRVCKFEVIEQCQEMVNTNGYAQESTYDQNRDWDDDLDDKSYDEDDVEVVLDLANEFCTRYTDRNVLALRIEEELSKPTYSFVNLLSLADILEILNDNEDQWLDNVNDGDEDCDGSCLICGDEKCDSDDEDDDNDNGNHQTGFRIYF